MIKEIVSSIVSDGITDRAASFVDKQIDVDEKRERLNELLIQINSAIEFAKAREPIQNSWLRKWLEDLQKASKEGGEVQSVFEVQTVAGDTTTSTMNLLKVPIRFYQQGKNINMLNKAVMRLEKKASGCDEFLQRLRYELEEQRHETYTKKVGKLERTVAPLRNSLRSLNSNGKFKRSKKTKLPLGRTAGSTSAIVSQPELRDQNHNENHDEPEDIVYLSGLREQNHDEPENIEDVVYLSGLREQNHDEPENIEDAILEKEKDGRPLPKFAEWDVNDPASADGYTVIFNKARDEKKWGNTQDTGSPMKDGKGAKATACHTRFNSKNFVKYFFRLFRCIIPSSSASTRTEE